MKRHLRELSACADVTFLHIDFLPRNICEKIQDCNCGSRTHIGQPPFGRSKLRARLGIATRYNDSSSHPSVAPS